MTLFVFRLIIICFFDIMAPCATGFGTVPGNRPEVKVLIEAEAATCRKLIIPLISILVKSGT